MEHFIRDLRDMTHFKNRTFSGFKKSQAIHELVKSVADAHVERACYYSADLVASGHLLHLWDAICASAAHHAHSRTCSIAVYLSRRFEVFKKVMENVTDDLAARNHPEIRKLFAEVCTVLATTEHTMPYVRVRVDVKTDFNIGVMARRFRAPNLSYGKALCKDEDAPEIFPAVNELAWNLRHGDTMSAMYWIEWLLGYANVRRKCKRALRAEPRRPWAGEKLSQHPVWVLWDALREQADLSGPQSSAGVDALEKLYAVKLSLGSIQRRWYLLYWAVELSQPSTSAQTAQRLSRDDAKLAAAVTNIDRVYGEIGRFTKSVCETLKDKGSSAAERSRARLALLSQNDTTTLS